MPTHFDGSAREKRSLDLFIKLIRAAASVETRTSGPLTTVGLTSSQFGALETLYFLGPLPAGRLAEKHLKSPNNFTVVISNLEKRGLVSREKAPHDRRVVMIELTDAGRAEVERTMPAYVQTIVDNLEVLTAREQEQLGELLRKVGRAQT
ncbi:MarR family transcriptional regulator [Streptomyces mirabilis]|uniref:MarR family winged helix-turn-helix transcriptional regulator n=1 Tax=Streptomyces TaxID=1883 RepID=UPI000BB10A44|nr:MarR family transcriptional regulator [Streptomyces sp. Ag82_O1-15]PBD02326.1 MarR family transcriptional regulator [Streptomyces sp. Ag82_O1-15]